MGKARSCLYNKARRASTKRVLLDHLSSSVSTGNLTGRSPPRRLLITTLLSRQHVTPVVLLQRGGLQSFTHSTRSRLSTPTRISLSGTTFGPKGLRQPSKTASRTSREWTASQHGWSKTTWYSGVPALVEWSTCMG